MIEIGEKIQDHSAQWAQYGTKFQSYYKKAFGGKDFFKKTI